MDPRSLVRAANTFRESARAGLPGGLPRPFSWVLSRRIKRIHVTMDQDALCDFGWLLWHGLSMWARWTPGKRDDRLAQRVEIALRNIGCKH